MYYPREAQRDFHYTRKMIALILLLPLFMVLLFARKGALTYACISVARADTQAVIASISPHYSTQTVDYRFTPAGGELTLGTFVTQQVNDYHTGQHIAISYSRWLPTFSVRTELLADMAINLYVALAALAAMLGCLLVAAHAVRSLRRHQLEDRYY
ncbi:hypothetical protein WH50_25040 [Pokkaliibacter plantistimulans]|uniref:DUF3592 domain-containing protein n=1 Tax=Pokkaliibacter plantistimulans TaxID=1635171 RepID=A0ABX5LST8_9GAMM|nr:hypothetical protein [Pokkaliibacter plantistimulans]PXF28670.1 hypothetical protein WH50_25040 [Pokkaliibacter plantistimulans]